MATSCEEATKSLGTLEIDGLRVSINSAGIAYDVANENRLDSSHGLNYVVAFSVENAGKDPVHFNDDTFRLFDPAGNTVPARTDPKSPTGALNLHAYTTTVEPGKTEEVLLMYSVKEHGEYRFQFVSPVSGTVRVARLPAS
ncbi:hypothetical protein GCM10028786_21130 [Flaviaesturariibacter terrae]